VTNSAYHDTLTLREARDRFLSSNGFRVQDYSAPTYGLRIWGLSLRFPNTKAHRWATPLHDLHHILTGYETDWTGEAEIAAWELRAGCRTLDVYCLDIAGVIIGLFMSPARVWRAFVKAKGHRTLYRDGVLRESALQMTVGEVRSRLGIPPGGLKPLT
jgi:hypothetical protein